MPIYVYRCAKCGHELEVQRSMSDPPLRRCPSCKAMKLQRVFHPVGIAFKGSGFHKTDYGSSKPAKESSSSSDTSSKTETKKTETKSSDAKKASSE